MEAAALSYPASNCITALTPKRLYTGGFLERVFWYHLVMSSQLPEAVASACSGRLDDLAVADLQDLAVSLRTAVQRLTGKLDEVLGELEERSGGQVLEHPGADGPSLWMSTRTWWRASSVVSGGQAGRDLRRATTAARLPVLRDAVTSGALSPAQAAVLYRLDGRIPAPELEASQEALVEVAAPMDPEALAQWVRHLIATHCEPAFEDETRKAHERRYLQTTRNPDGTVSGRFVLADEDAEVVLTVLEPLARRQGLKDERTAGQRRADALVEVCAGALQWMDLPQAGGRRPQLVYVMPSGWACGDAGPSLLELLEAGLVVPDSPEGLEPGPPHPASFEQHVATAPWTGPQSRARLATTLCDATLSRVFRDSIGQVSGLESLTGEITPAQRRALVARDRHCTARGCTRPPAFCDAHHLRSREEGGATTLDNLVLLCRRHHVQWHRGKLGLGDLHVPWLSRRPAGLPPPELVLRS